MSSTTRTLDVEAIVLQPQHYKTRSHYNTCRSMAMSSHKYD